MSLTEKLDIASRTLIVTQILAVGFALFQFSIVIAIV